MGLASIVLAPVMAPVWGFRFVMERLRDEAESVLADEGRGFAELIDLSMRHSAGKLSDAEYAEQEAALLDRLSSIRDYRDELLRADDDLGDDDAFEVGDDEAFDVSVEDVESFDDSRREPDDVQ